MEKRVGVWCRSGRGKAGRLTYVSQPSRLAPGEPQREKVRRDALLT
jgi:hypothetical protein